MDLFNYLLFLKNLCIGRKICQFFRDSRAVWLLQLLLTNLCIRKTSHFLHDPRASWVRQLLPKKKLSILLAWFKSLMTYSATPKELCSRKICGFFMSDSRAGMTSSTTPEELYSRKNCGFFLSDSQASLPLQLLPKNCVQERFLGSS